MVSINNIASKNSKNIEKNHLGYNDALCSPDPTNKDNQALDNQNNNNCSNDNINNKKIPHKPHKPVILFWAINIIHIRSQL